jgi:hypothetical protein
MVENAKDVKKYNTKNLKYTLNFIKLFDIIGDGEI